MNDTPPTPTQPSSDRWRDNAPLLGVAAIVIAALIVLGLINPEPRSVHSPAAIAATSGTATLSKHAQAELRALPASGTNPTGPQSQLAPDSARAQNAAAPFVDMGRNAARPFAFAGNGADRFRARECLALAGLAEAGAGDADQRAVMQVILNRVRHPAFAKTVCGVVFEGSQRATGCQFTFTCDGSLARTYPESLWSAARERADEALGGYTHAAVGNATHYHTDWVYPWWSNKLDKVAQVGTHLFFRWRGTWGSTAALSARYRGGEPDPAALRLAANRAPDRAGEPGDAIGVGTIVTGLAEPVRSIAAATPPPVPGGLPGSPAPGVHFMQVGTADSAAQMMARARTLCPGDRYCQVYGWTDAGDIPERLPLTPAARSTLRFSFLPARNGNGEAVYFDCRLYPNAPAAQCLPRARN